MKNGTNIEYFTEARRPANLHFDRRFVANEGAAFSPGEQERPRRYIYILLLPFAANSVPMTFRLKKDGRQFVVVASGGNPLGDMGDALIAYALPE